MLEHLGRSIQLTICWKILKYFSICYFTLYDTVVVVFIISLSPTMVSLALSSDIKTLSFVISDKSLPTGIIVLSFAVSNHEVLEV